MTLTPTAIREYDREQASDTETATFGLGCFWGPDASLGAIDGVVRTRVGYAGGTEPEPTYECIGDHTEVVQADYDPEAVSFAVLLDHAFDQHDPSAQPRDRQYRNAVFTSTDHQEAVLDRYLAEEYPRKSVQTRTEPLSEFHLAEPYHQKFSLRGTRWVTDALAGAGYDDADVRESPAAAKLNARLAGHEASLPFLGRRPDPAAFG